MQRLKGRYRPDSHVLMQRGGESVRPCAPRRDFNRHGDLPLEFDIEAPGSHVPHVSLCQPRAAYLPVTVLLVNRPQLDFVPDCQIGLVSMPIVCFRESIRGSLPFAFLVRTG